MRRLYAWVAGSAGGLTAVGLLRRRGRKHVEAPADGADARAAELRAKLAETREEPVPDAAAGPAPESTAASSTERSEPEDVEARRRSVHEQGRAAIDAMSADATSADASAEG